MTAFADAVALSASDGEELWRASLGEADSGPYRATSNLVYLENTSASVFDEDGEVRFFDTQGKTGSLPLDRDDRFSSSSFELDDTSYLIDTNTGLLYDESLKVLGDYPGWLTPVDPGLYSSDEQGLAYYEIGGSSPVWSVALDDKDEARQVTPIDDGVLVIVGRRVVRYE